MNGVLGQPYDYLMMNNLKRLVKPHREVLSQVTTDTCISLYVCMPTVKHEIFVS